jgi:hypothetical protein
MIADVLARDATAASNTAARTGDSHIAARLYRPRYACPSPGMITERATATQRYLFGRSSLRIGSVIEER